MISKVTLFYFLSISLSLAAEQPPQAVVVNKCFTQSATLLAFAKDYPDAPHVVCIGTARLRAAQGNFLNQVRTGQGSVDVILIDSKGKKQRHEVFLTYEDFGVGPIRLDYFFPPVGVDKKLGHGRAPDGGAMECLQKNTLEIFFEVGIDRTLALDAKALRVMARRTLIKNSCQELPDQSEYYFVPVKLKPKG